MLWKCCIQYASKSGKLSRGHRTGKGEFSNQSQRKEMPKNAQTTAQLPSSHISMLKILKARLQQCVNNKHPDGQAGFKKGRGIRYWIGNICGSPKKQESSRKASTSDLLTLLKPLTVWISTNYGKFWKRWEYQTTWPASWGICMQVKNQQLELDMEQQTGSK